MTRVDFYLLPTHDANSRLKFVCKLAGKAVSEGIRLHIWTENAAESATLDRLLWTYKDVSFVPHASVDTSQADCPVTLDPHHQPSTQGRILVNLSQDVPDSIESLERIIEIVDEDTERKTQGRKHYRLYRQQGCNLKHHQVGTPQ
ncbi:DNA polymerase III subunit chi [Acidihalobacter prosperus]